MPKPKLIIYQKFWDLEYVEMHPEMLFIFGDNNIGKGEGGQAVIRFADNAMGIPTKKYPSMSPESFYSDKDYNDNKKRINQAIEQIKDVMHTYSYVVLPKDGLGTGLADLPNRAPRTFAYLNKKIQELQQELS